MNRFLDRIVSLKREEVKRLDVYGERKRAVYSFKKSLKGYPNIIAEIKERSPSAGFIAPMEIEKIVERYRRFARAISVLTDREFFGGSFERLREVASLVEMPVLCKDFIISRKQIDRAFIDGADMILLIVRILTDEELSDLHRYAGSLGLDVLVEVHTEEELKRATGLGCDIIGVNARDLDTLEISLKRAKYILDRIEKKTVRVAESGIRSREDMEFLRESCDAFLIGEALLRGERLWV